MERSSTYSKLVNMKVSSTLFLEFKGSETSNNDARSIWEELSKNNNGSDFQWAASPEEQKKLWKARHDVYYSVKALGNNMKVYSTDVCVPISRLVECISWAENEVKKLGLTAPMVGHVGDGNFHSIVLYDLKEQDKQQKIRQYSNDRLNKDLELECTLTDKQGIGLQKKNNN